MVFSSIIFLFFFLPIALLLHLVAGRHLRNTALLAVSLIFYAWGEELYVLLMLCSILVNYIFGILISRPKTKKRKKILLAIGVMLNLLPLFYFKYSGFVLENFLNILAVVGIESTIEAKQLHLPIGISFFTFQALSYIVDVYRGMVQPQKNVLNIGLYISLFPQLIAGPIVRYHDVAKQLVKRTVTAEKFAYGVERFVFGLGKKVLLANPMGAMADQIFSLGIDQISTTTAWLGIICYTLQIYFDFSGYSDMAIGLGRMFGFRFLENFNYPYIARSIREFWRRWHISLSNWFRDYLYIPLGGNRLGSTRTGVNLLIVFLLCGFWHGASWNFIIWGLCHGLFLVLERGRLGRMLQKTPSVMQHLYVLLVVINAWVFFRAETLGYALQYLGVMYGIGSAETMYPYIYIGLDYEFYTTLAVALLFSSPLYPAVVKFVEQSDIQSRPTLSGAILFAKCSILCFLLLSASLNLANGAYNPFIYFRF